MPRPRFEEGPKPRKKRVNLWLDAEAFDCVKETARVLPGGISASSILSDMLRGICPVMLELKRGLESGDREVVKALLEGYALDLFGQLGTELHTLRTTWDEVGREEEAE